MDFNDPNRARTSKLSAKIYSEVVQSNQVVIDEGKVQFLKLDILIFRLYLALKLNFTVILCRIKRLLTLKSNEYFLSPRDNFPIHKVSLKTDNYPVSVKSAPILNLLLLFNIGENFMQGDYLSVFLQ